MESKFLSPTEAALECGVQSQTIYNWLKTGKLEVAYRLGRSIRIARTSIEELKTKTPKSKVPSGRDVFGESESD